MKHVSGWIQSLKKLLDAAAVLSLFSPLFYRSLTEQSYLMQFCCALGSFSRTALSQRLEMGHNPRHSYDNATCHEP